MSNLSFFGDFTIVFLLVLFGSLISLVGGLIFLYIKPWSRFLAKYSTSFAAGVLLTVSLLSLIPEAQETIGESAYLWVLGGFLVSYIFENMICSFSHHDERGHKHSRGHSHRDESVIGVMVAGDTIHNFIDGAAIATSYLINPGLGVITALSTFLHEVPHEISDFGVMIKAGWKKRKVILINLLSALLSFVGAGMVFFLPGFQNILGYLLAISAGIFLYIGASDFLPHASDEISHKKSMVVLLLGVLVMYLIISLVPTF